MPLKPVDHQKTIIYKIVCNDVNVKELYVGSTASFKDRKSKHKSNCNNPKCKKYNYKIYQTIRANGGFDNWSMILIEPYSCNSKLEAVKRERYWLEELSAKLNSQVPSRTKKEYYQDNAEKIREKNKQYTEKISEYQQEYRQNNRAELLEYNKEYRENNREKINEKQKEYRKDNAEKIREKNKQYRENNREKILEKVKEKIECPHCKKLISRAYLTTHKRKQHTNL